MAPGEDHYGGVMYLMYWLRDGEIVPLYVGKAGKYGRDGGGLSANLEQVPDGGTRKFARWGDGHYYHIGNLSAVLFDEHDHDPGAKYRQWADQLFLDDRPTLREPVYFWVRAWHEDDVGPYHDFEESLGQLEYQLIGLAADCYPDALLNSEGT